MILPLRRIKSISRADFSVTMRVRATSIARLLGADRACNPLGDGTQTLEGVDLDQLARLAIVVDERLRLRVVNFKSFRDRLGTVVFTLNQRAAVVVVDAGDLRRIRQRVIRAAVARIRPAPTRAARSGPNDLL